MNVLICIDAFHDGGAEMFAIRLVNNFGHSEKVNLYFCAIRPWETRENKQAQLIVKSVINYIEILGDPFEDKIFNLLMGISQSLNLKKAIDFLTKKRIQLICKKYKIDIINSHSWDSDYTVSVLKDKLNFKLICSFHGHYELFKGSWNGFDNACRHILNRADAVVYLSPKHLGTLDEFKYPMNKRFKIYHGIDHQITTTITKYDPSKPLKIIMVARGIVEKGWEEAILSTIEINNRRQGSLVLDLIGEGEALEQLSEKYKDQRYINFLGHQQDVISYIQKAHIGLLPSYYSAESLPNSVIEYLICGKPVILSDVGSLPEMIESEGSFAGIVIPSKGSKVDVEKLSNAIQKYIDEPNKLAEHSTYAIQAAEKFRMKNCVNDYLMLYQKVLNKELD